MKSPSTVRQKHHGLTRDSGSFDDFKSMVARRTEASDWPFAVSVQSNILVYDGDAVRAAASRQHTRQALAAEWSDALADGPGVFFIRRAVGDMVVVDRATAIFDHLIAEQHRTGTGGGDHFSRPGANDRVWNAVQKHCLADAANFVRYFGNTALDLACRAWLGDGYQMTAQVNRVNPGGEAQVAHRDYHLGFMTPQRMMSYPAHVHRLSPVLTLQGAVAHCDILLETGPTRFLPFSHMFAEGYLAFSRPEYQEFFDANYMAVPLQKGDAVFFNPALMHASGANVSENTYRMANLLQVSSAFGRAMESVDRMAMVLALYPELLRCRKSEKLSQEQIECAIAACAEGYAFPTNLDLDPPIGGMSPKTQARLMVDALAAGLSTADFEKQICEHDRRRRPMVGMAPLC